MGLGRIIRRRGDRSASLALFETAAAVWPEHAGAKMEVAADLRELGRVEVEPGRVALRRAGRRGGEAVLPAVRGVPGDEVVAQVLVRAAEGERGGGTGAGHRGRLYHNRRPLWGSWNLGCLPQCRRLKRVPVRF